MQEADRLLAAKLMDEFAQATGISHPDRLLRRYLWTDAFAVCNFLELFRAGGEERYRRYAIELVNQVHEVLGKHRPDDSRSGWISGLGEAEGREHPTVGGLRIGKPLPERAPDAPLDERLEWDRDGQYYHYLTKWMHALDRMSAVTGEVVYSEWARDLARSAHATFLRPVTQDGPRRLCWKMSTDLSYPLVPFSGLHDPLDGLVTYLELRAQAQRLSLSTSALDTEIADLGEMCKGRDWSTDDPLGIGGLLFDACRMLQLGTDARERENAMLLTELLDASLTGMARFSREGILEQLAARRLAFRELGLAIGLRGVVKMQAMVGLGARTSPDISPNLHALQPYASLGKAIEATWRLPANRENEQWKAHQDINAVMLATALDPDMFLSI